ncbi:hypothetical protein MKX03_035739 [Papaver bracteatum]|nr:hypothetical protein MKX03_035739 [Papaver bracteatum]
MVVQQPKTFVVMVDNTLMSWSKGRMHATKHRVFKAPRTSERAFGVYPKTHRLNATTSSKRKMLLEYWIVIVQGFKQRATGNMDDPYLIPGLARKLVRRPFLRRVVFHVK